MRVRTPQCVRRFCNKVLPRLLEHADGRRTMETVRAVVATDRWNSFDKFKETSATLIEQYEAAGAVADKYTVQTGGPVGTGRWIIQEAEDIRAATLEVIDPANKKIADYRDNPWHVIQWTASTPADGIVGELVVVDSVDEMQAFSRKALVGKVVLTRLDPRRELPFHRLAGRGAAAVISDQPVPNHPHAVKWGKFGFGGIDIDHAASRIVGLMISPNQGEALRHLVDNHDKVAVKLQVDVRKYVGSHDVVSGVVLGRDDPQDEAWAIAHSSEPGAVDNASGVAVCVEIARILEGISESGELARPRRSVRLLHGYECHGFFNYLENTWRLKPPLAGVCIDSVGVKPGACDGRLGWNATTPMTAGFVDHLGACILRKTLRLTNPGYRLSLGPFVSTPDTLIADPKYGFPCGYIETDRGKNGAFEAYHSSADTDHLLSPQGLEVCAGAMAAYLYFLADATTPDLLELADWETARSVAEIATQKGGLAEERAMYIRTRHHASMEHLKRWMWGGDRAEILAHLDRCERRVCGASPAAAHRTGKRPRRSGAGRVPHRKAPLPPFAENAPGHIAERISNTGLPRWALYWADGIRDLSDIAELLTGERGEKVDVGQVAEYFEAHDELGYVELVRPGDMITKAQLVRDLKKLGVRKGMDLMVHSALSGIGFVKGGPETVIDALLEAVGKTGTLLMPSFNHHEAFVYNPMTTPTKTGAVPDAMWRRPDAVRSIQCSHPVSAIGPKAEEWCAGHLKAGIWSAESPIGKFVQEGGHILSVGVGQNSSSAYHVAEASMGRGCLGQFGRKELCLGADGTVCEVRGAAWRAGRCKVSPGILGEALDAAGLRRHGQIGNARATLVKAVDLWEMRRRHLADACPTCSVKPNKTFRTRYPAYVRRRR